MSSSGASGSRRMELPLLRFGSSNKQVVLPFDIILHISNYMKFVDYRNFVRAVWPIKEDCYDPEIEKKFWELSTHWTTLDFLNGKPLKIEYNYDPSRKSAPVLINSECLLPVFGGIAPPENEKFLGIKTLSEFVETSVHLDQCLKATYKMCPCKPAIKKRTVEGFVKPQEELCKKNHFHHYCSQHVIFWLHKICIVVLPIRSDGANTDVSKHWFASLEKKIFFRGLSLDYIE